MDALEAPRRRGRPKTAAPGCPVTAWVPAPMLDNLIVLANRADMSVSALVREVLIVSLAPPAKTP